MISSIFTIAGSNPTVGAGIQANIKTLSPIRTYYAMSEITDVVTQNMMGLDSMV
jgi:hydroxymethylpyrimidine/phosphomethylpyrimidine kinase